VYSRVIPYWHDSIAKDILDNKNVAIVGHDYSLRCIIQHLNKLSNEEVIGLKIPTGVPLVYELNNKLKPIRHFYLSEKDMLQKRSKTKDNKKDKIIQSRTISMPRIKPKKIANRTLNVMDMTKHIKETLNWEDLSSPDSKSKKNMENFMTMMREYKCKK
jgi:hypothetical protein